MQGGTSTVDIRHKLKNGHVLWTNMDLQQAFDLFNSRYFSGKLAVVRLEFSDIGDSLGKTSRYRQGKRRSLNDGFGIKISKNIRGSRRTWALTLLHEMVHVENRCRYSCGIKGHYFNRRMKELAKYVAFNGLW